MTSKKDLGPLNSEVKHFPVELLKELGKRFIHANAAAVELGRKGGKVGGKARAEKLSPERRSEIAKAAALERWRNKENREREALNAWARNNGL